MEIEMHPDVEKMREDIEREELRDHFAGLAMQAILPLAAVSSTPTNGEMVARHSYMIAEAMLAERAKRLKAEPE